MQSSATAASPAKRRARATIKHHANMVLSDRDRAVFFDALVHPPKPNARLRRAFRSAKKRVVAG